VAEGPSDKRTARRATYGAGRDITANQLIRLAGFESPSGDEERGTESVSPDPALRGLTGEKK